MKIATWNVNSIRARLERVLAWVDAARPDVLCLQETKVEDAAFPVEPFAARGYHVALAGQRTYNGVAILSRPEPADVARGLDDGEDDPQARLIAATVDGVRVLCAYAPNGEAPDSEKFPYKLRWLGRLRRYLDGRADPGRPLALCGDFNVAPEARDVCDPEAWSASTLYHPQARGALAEVAAFGLVDVFRQHHAEPGFYSWWDYRMLAFPKNQGLRIDHVLATRPLAERSASAAIDREERKGKQPSDHAPVVVEFRD
jgi:exodeoxyribonuclease-3